MAAMCETVEREGPRCRVVAVLLVAVLALALAMGLASHHDEALQTAPVAATEIAKVVSAIDPVPTDEAPFVACSFLLLCAVVLLLAVVRTRRPATPHPAAEPRARRLVQPPAPAPAIPPSLAALSISRT